MARIRGSDTRPELMLRRTLHARGLRFRLQRRFQFGRPDLVFIGRKLAVFVDGCFWHGCPAHYIAPKSREQFWAGKLRENVGRDRRQTAIAEKLGWTVLRVWEHEILEDVSAVAQSVALVLAGGQPNREHWQTYWVRATVAGEQRGLLELRDESASVRIAEAPCSPAGLPLSPPEQRLDS